MHGLPQPQMLLGLNLLVVFLFLFTGMKVRVHGLPQPQMLLGLNLLVVFLFLFKGMKI